MDVPNRHLTDPAGLAPAVLAYLGDAVFELYIRETLIRSRKYPTAHALHRRTTALVCAPAQARMARALAASFSTEEADILRRGRNAHCGRVPAGSEMAEYRLATGLECLIGYLHLSGQTDRLRELLAQALSG